MREYVTACGTGSACAEGTGKLPACGPLANPYVPFQPVGAAKYEAQKGIIRGTLFPGLELPFMDMVNKTELSDTTMHQLQALCFAVQELALYLDTHGDDDEAFELYKTYVQMAQEMTRQYQESCGPLSHMTAENGKHYGWINGPWPWEYGANKR